MFRDSSQTIKKVTLNEAHPPSLMAEVKLTKDSDEASRDLSIAYRDTSVSSPYRMKPKPFFFETET